MTQQRLTIPQAIDLGKQYHQASRFAEAEAIYRQVLAAQPNHGEALHLLGLLAYQAGRAEMAAEMISRAIAIEPNAIHYQVNYAQSLAAIGRIDEAIVALQRVVSVQPNFPEAHYNLGNLLQAAGRDSEAISAYRLALSSRRDYVEALNNLGNVLQANGEADEAIALLQRAIALRPALAEAHLNLGIALLKKQEFDKALALFDRALELHPGHVDALNGRANALVGLGRTDEAIDLYRRIQDQAPQHIASMNNLAHTLADIGEPQQAIEVYQKALRIAPDHPAVHYNLGLTLIQQGNLLDGFREYEWRWNAKELGLFARGFQTPLWDGSGLNGRQILLFAEQGFGDTIQFARYIPLVVQRGGRIVLRCQPQLAPLLRQFEGIDQIVLPNEPLPAFDVHCPLMSLPSAFKTTLETIPNHVPYLRADPTRIEEWTQRIGSLQTGLKVGLVWAGQPKHDNDRTRSMKLEDLAPLAIEGVELVSLQKRPANAQSRKPPAGMRLVDWTDELHDFADTAALIEHLDLVIGVDTAVIHLAAAMGKTTWALLPFRSDWRWMRDREDSPWYPTMRLFRQDRSARWEDPIQRLAAALQKRLQDA